MKKREINRDSRFEKNKVVQVSLKIKIPVPGFP